MGGAASHHEHELVLDVLQLTEPAFAVNGSHQIVAWNDGAERLLGLRAEEVIGLRCYDALSTSAGALCGDCRYHCGPSIGATRPTTAAGPRRAASAGGRRALVSTARSGGHCSVAVTTLAAYTRAGQLRVVHLLREAPPALEAFEALEALDGRDAHPRAAPRSHDTVEALDSLGHLRSHDTAASERAAISRPSAAPSDPSGSSGKQRRPTMLTQRELEVLRLLGAGHSTDDISRELNITRVTARNHVNKVLDKLGVNSRLQAVVIASQLRLI